MARTRKRRKSDSDECDYSLWWTFIPEMVFYVIPFLFRMIFAGVRGIAALVVAIVT